MTTFLSNPGYHKPVETTLFVSTNKAHNSHHFDYKIADIHGWIPPFYHNEEQTGTSKYDEARAE